MRSFSRGIYTSVDMDMTYRLGVEDAIKLLIALGKDDSCGEQDEVDHRSCYSWAIEKLKAQLLGEK